MSQTIAKKYNLTIDTKFQYVALVLIHEMINYQKYFPISLDGDDMFLFEYLEFMRGKGLVEVKNEKYVPTSKGRKYLENFYDKYFEYLKVFDIYCAVDLAEGEFAFASIFEDMNKDQWNEFLNEERFSDVRIAVAEFKKINPVEIVFMSFLNEGRFETNREGWQIYLTKDEVWNEILTICNTAIDLETLKENDVIQDVVQKGTDLMFNILKQDEEIRNNENNEPEIQEEIITETETVEEYVETVEPRFYTYSYFNPYMDIYYVSPFWITPFLF
jgi:hypothetical protein